MSPEFIAPAVPNRRTSAGLIILLLVVSADAGARIPDWLGLTAFDMEAFVEFAGIDRHSKSVMEDKSQDLELRTGVRLGVEGHILDPAIARFSLNVGPTFSWSEFDSLSFTDDQSTDLLNYLFQLDVFQGTPGPLGLGLFLNRSSSLNTSSLGARSDDSIDTKLIYADWKQSAFPMRFKYERRSLDQDFLSGVEGNRIQRDEILDIFSVRGHSSKSRLLLRHQSMDDRIPERDQDFDLSEARLTHKLPWGQSSELRSEINIHDRTGFNASQRITLDEAAFIRHTKAVSSRSSYRYSSIERNTVTREHNGTFDLRHRLFNNLNSSAQASVNSRQSDDLDEFHWRTGLSTHYHKSQLFGAAVNAGIDISYQYTDRDSNRGLVEVIDETQLVPLDGGLILNQRFVVTTSIIVTDDTGTVVYAEGVDYNLLVVADDLTLVQIIPGSRINLGETILVSYQAQALPSQEFSTLFTGFNLSVDLGWVSMSHSERRSDDQLLSGAAAGFLNDTRDSVSNVEFSWDMTGLNVNLGAERRFRVNRGFESMVLTYHQVLTWVPPGKLRFNLAATESFSEREGRDTDLLNFELSAIWNPLPNLSIRPSLGAWNRIDRGEVIAGGERDDTFLTGGFTLRWRYRQIAVDFGYRHNNQNTEFPQLGTQREATNDRLFFNLSRRF